MDNDKTQEALLIIGDSVAGENKRWFKLLLFVVIAVIPVYFVTKITYLNLSLGKYSPPALTGQVQVAPLEVMQTQIVRINASSYSGFIKIKNPNLDWGVAQLSYTAVVKSTTGETIATINNQSFVLPASEKYLILPRFQTLLAPPFTIDFIANDPKFVHKPDNFPAVNLELQRNQVTTQGSDTLVTGVLKNNSPFTVTRVDLQAIIYNEKGEIVGINYTNVNDLLSGELRSFQTVWPGALSGNPRVVITPEINFYLKDILKTQGSVSPFD